MLRNNKGIQPEKVAQSEKSGISDDGIRNTDESKDIVSPKQNTNTGEQIKVDKELAELLIGQENLRNMDKKKNQKEYGKGKRLVSKRNEYQYGLPVIRGKTVYILTVSVGI
jgi:hypothetical protein